MSYTVVEQKQMQQRTVLLRDKMAGVCSPEVRSEPSFWSILARKAKSVLVEDNSRTVNDSPTSSRSQPPNDDTPVTEQSPAMKLNTQASMGRPLQKSLDAIASSLSLLGDTLGTAIEVWREPLTPDVKAISIEEVEHSSHVSGCMYSMRMSLPGFVKEGFHMIDGKSSTVKAESPEASKPLQRNSSIRKKVEDVQARQSVLNTQDSAPGDVQLKASRDVAMAMAAKAKALLRELKTVKAEQSFLKNRCAQLEEENSQLREGANQGDDFVRQQLESLLAEKQRLAQENANYARENQILQELVEYHHLTLQDVALLDDRLTGENEDYSSDSCDFLISQQLSFHDR